MKAHVAEESEQKRRRRLRLIPSKAQFRSAMTNGRIFERDVDLRSKFMRRLRDLIYTHETDLGGVETLSEGQRAIVRRVSMLQVQLEQLEHRFAEADGAASRLDLEAYQRCSNSLRRLLESLGLHRGRIAKDITSLGDILRSNGKNTWEPSHDGTPP
jgi:hypothetical protein